MRITKQLLTLTFTLSIFFSASAQESGTLILLKDKTIFWGKKEMPVHINNINVGTLPSNTKLELTLKPGRYSVESQAPFKSNPTDVDITAGQITYLKSFTTPNLADVNAQNTTWTVISAGSGESFAKKYTDGTITIEGAGSLNTLSPGAAMAATAAVASAVASPEAASTDNSEKSEEELKKEAVDGFFKEMSPLDIKEVIANNERQKQLEAIADLYDFTVVEGATSAEKESTYSAAEFEEPPKLEKEFPNLKYRRSSVYTLIVNDTTRAGYPYILSAFGNADLPSKFNNHNVGPYLIDGEGGVRKEEEQAANITEYINSNDVAKKLVAKWFDRSPKGGFDMELISKRGFYNASELDVAMAESSARGTALLADAGEELIGNTFVLVNDYNFTNKEEVAKKVGGAMKIGAFIAAAAGEEGLADGLNTAAEVVDFVGKGFIIRTRSYLYQLDWNADVANQFYSQFWTSDDNLDPTKVNAFNKTDIFKMKLVGYQAATADVQSTKATTKSNEELIAEATIKAQNKAIAKLEKTYEQFRTKTPLFSTDPLLAKIGTKEGVEKNDKFEVLEQLVDGEGRTRYKRKAVIKAGDVWDNEYTVGAETEQTDGITGTTFKGSSKGLYEGMLIRQIN